MKKFMLTGLLVCALLVVAACRSNNDIDDTPPPQRTQGQETQPNQPEAPPSQESSEVASGNETNAPPLAPGSYYTFGDTINLWDEWELIFFDNVVLTRPTHFLWDGATEREQEIYDGEIVKVPAILTNVSETNKPQGLMMDYTVYGSNGQVQSVRDIDTVSGLMFDINIGRIPGIHHSADAGEVIEGYVFLIYDGSGDYWIRWPDRLGGMQVRLPISR